MNFTAELEVFAAVAAVISAFHGATELVANLRKRRSQDYDDVWNDEGRQLQVSLETTELQLGFRFSTEEARFGDIVRIGDAIARDCFLQIAVVVQTDIIMDLQLAAKFRNAVVDFKRLQAAAVANRKDAFDALDGLKQRMISQRSSLCTFSDTHNLPDNVHGSPISSPASRKTSRSPVPDVSLPEAVCGFANGVSHNGLSSLPVRHFDEQRGDRAASNIQNYVELLNFAVKNHNLRPTLHYLLKGKTSQERALIMKDINQIITAYQSLRIEGGREDALARLTGNEAGSKRDTLAVLQGDYGHQRETKALHQDALLLLKDLPHLSKSENTEYTAYIHNFLDEDDDRRLSEWIQEQCQQPIPIVSRWSTTSAGSSRYSGESVYSSDPPSLYYDGSRSSSRASGNSPAEPASPTTQYFPSSAHDTVPFWSLNTIDTPPDNLTCASSRTNSPTRQLHSRANSPACSPSTQTSSAIRQPASRALTPTFTPQRPKTPTSAYGSRNASSEPRGRSRIHLLPTDDWRSNIDTTPMLHLLRPVPSSQLCITPSVKSTATTAAAQEKMMDGRPCKDNNYWGFCKGAWATREDTSKGLALTSRPEGMFSTSQMWQCRHCLFEGFSYRTPHPTKRNKKDAILDPKTHTSATGIRYRWSFLAKSHVKKTSYTSGRRNGSGEEAKCNFGCVICSVEGTVTGIYGSVETLMNHIAHEHIYTGNINFATMARSNIIVGRIAENEEEWDVNIPSQENLLF